MKNNISIKNKRSFKDKIGLLLFIILCLCIIYVIIKIATSPSERVNADEYVKVKSDYVLMLVQCLLGLAVMMIPSIIERKKAIDIPDNMEILYFIFLYLAIVLGEVRDFYYLIPHWDIILHAFSGSMLASLGFFLVNIFNDSKNIEYHLTPFFIALFSFCFALTAGAIWEIYEYLIDGLLSLNMQKFALADGTELVGRAALADTMEDIIVDALSALAISTLGYFSLKKKDKYKAKHNAETNSKCVEVK